MHFHAEGRAHQANDFVPVAARAVRPGGQAQQVVGVLRPLLRGGDRLFGDQAIGFAQARAVIAAEAALRERRRLVLVPRETPLALTHLRNMATLSEAGAVILPACPAFYRNPQSVDDLVDFITFRTMSAMGIRGGTMREWGDEK